MVSLHPSWLWPLLQHMHTHKLFSATAQTIPIWQSRETDYRGKRGCHIEYHGSVDSQLISFRKCQYCAGLELLCMQDIILWAQKTTQETWQVIAERFWRKPTIIAVDVGFSLTSSSASNGIWFFPIVTQTIMGLSGKITSHSVTLSNQSPTFRTVPPSPSRTMGLHWRLCNITLSAGSDNIASFTDGVYNAAQSGFIYHKIACPLQQRVPWLLQGIPRGIGISPKYMWLLQCGTIIHVT